MKAEIQQSTLKQSNEAEVNIFCAKVLNFFNPKFEDPKIEEELAIEEIKTFAKRCELTSDEFMFALSLATEGKLKSEIDSDGNAETIKLFREIDIIKLGEVKAAYLRFKIDDPKYKKGKAEIKAFLDPPPAELTPEEKKESFRKFLKEEFFRMQTKGQILGSVRFYDLLRKENKIVKIAFVEKFLQTFKPEEFIEEKRSTQVHIASSKKVIKKDAFLSFKEHFVTSYIVKMELHNATEEKWIEHWENMQD